MSVIHLVNHAGEDIYDIIGSGKPFLADFKGNEDVTVTKLTGDLGSDFLDTFGGDYRAGNPDYITNFVGSLTNGTGDDVAGDLFCIQTTYGLSLQFDFTLGLTTNDHFLLIDCDNEERYQIQAYVKSGASYNQVSLTGWDVQNFPGSTQDLSLGDAPLWSPGTGIFQAAGQPLNEPLTILTPDQTIDRVIVTQTASTGSADIQFVHPFPVSPGRLEIALKGSNIVLSIPASSTVPSLETTSNLNSAVWTTLKTNATPGILAYPISTNRQQFFRLRY